MGKILHRYVFREIVTPFGLGLVVFTFVLLIARLVKLIELVVNRGLPTVEILRLLGYILPAFLELTVPMAMRSRPNVTPPLAKLSATFTGRSLISGFRKLRTNKQVNAIIADPAAENPAIKAIVSSAEEAGSEEGGAEEGGAELLPFAAEDTDRRSPRRSRRRDRSAGSAKGPQGAG